MNIKNIKVLGLLGLPLLAIAVAVMVFAIGHSSTNTAEATDPGTEMSLRIDASQTIQCGSPAAGKVCVGNGAKFDVIAVADVLPPNGIIFAGAWLNYGNTGLVSKSVPGLSWLANEDFPGGFPFAILDPGCSSALFLTVTDVANQGTAAGCITISDPAIPATPLQVVDYKGNVPFDLYTFSLTCDTDNSHTLSLLAVGEGAAGTSGSAYTEFGTAKAFNPTLTGLTVNCSVPPPATDTPTPTETFTPTPTSTPPPVPRMSKAPLLQNVFLTTQGAKVPPDNCLAGTNVGTLAEGLSQGVVSPDPKDTSVFQALAAFEFEVHYDNKKVCVDINVGAEFDAAGAICIVEDSVSKAQLEGVARIGCVTVGKGHGLTGEGLATIDVRPQPDLYSEMKPNQDNGNVVQLNNVNCDLGDEQGHAIPIFSCDDADITFRYLEGDVVPDCSIDVIDAQAIAFRWGVEKGSLIYKDFMNLEPSSQQQDNDIDINDLQFVYGRFGSTCEAPHPPQDPVNPKAATSP